MAEGWTIETLKEHLEAQICSVDRRHSELAGERNRAVDAALAAADQKDKTHNDVLGAMKEQQAMFVTKEQATAQFKGLAIALSAIVALASLIAIFIALWGPAK